MQVAPRLARFGIFGKPPADGVDEIEVLVHLFVFDQRAAQDDLRDEDHRDDVDRRLAFADQTRNKQADGDAADRGEHHGGEEDPEHPPHFEDPIGDEDEKDALDQGEEGKGQHFGQDIPAEAHVEIALALQDGPIPDDIIHAVGQAKEHGHDQGEEQIGRNVER